MSQSNIPDLLRRGIEAAKGGNRHGAHQFFQQAVASNGQCREGWLWLGILADGPEQATEQFYRALGVDADDPAAKAGLEWALAWLSEGMAPPLPAELEALFDQWVQGIRARGEPTQPPAPPSEPAPAPMSPTAQVEEEPIRQEEPPTSVEAPQPLAREYQIRPAEPSPTPSGEAPVAEPQAEAPVSPGPSLGKLLARSQAALAEERWEEAVAALEELAARSPSAEVHQKLGVALYHRGQKEEALPHFEAALYLEPEPAEPYANLGFIYQELGQLERAEEFLKQALARDEAMAEAQVALGQVLNAQGKLEEATRAWEKATNLRPDLAQLQVSLGETWIALGNHKAAAVAFQRALALQPDLPGVTEKLKTVAEVPLGKRLRGIFSRGNR